jgi:hypothetical protein
MNRRQKTGVALLMVGSNTATALIMIGLTSELLKKQDKAYEGILRNFKICQKSLDRFAREAPIEIAQPIIEEMAFDWTVRDLTPGAQIRTEKVSG